MAAERPSSLDADAGQTLRVRHLLPAAQASHARVATGASLPALATPCVTSLAGPRHAAIHNGSRRRWLPGAVAADDWPLIAATAHAHGIAPTGWFVQLGDDAETRALVIGVTWNWQRQWQLGTGKLGGYWELALGTWESGAGRDDAWLTQVGITPVFRFRPDVSLWFFEGAIGLNVLTPPYHSSEKRFSTRFNFGDHLAVGRSFGFDGRQELSLRVEHFSNGSIRRPNPDENFIQLRYARRF